MVRITVVASVALFLCLVALGALMHVPILPDEVGYLSIAKYLAGEGALNLSQISPYSIGQGVLLTPAFWVTNSPPAAYQIGTYVSALATALVPLVLVGIAKIFRVPVTWEVVAAALVVAVFPAYFYHNFTVWPEATFRLVFLLMLYALALAWDRAKFRYWLAFCTCVIVLLALHPRALGIVALTFPAILAGRLVGKLTRWQAWTVAGLTIAGYIAVRYANQSVHVALWGAEVPDASRIGILAASLTSLLGWKKAVAVAIGQAWSVCASSFGLFAIGVLVAWQRLRDGQSGKMVMIFAALAFAAVFMASVMQMVNFTRIDHVVYGRYNDGASTFFVWIGALWLVTGVRRGWVPLTASAIVIGLGLVTLYSFRNAVLGSMVTPNLSGFLWVDSIGVDIRAISLTTVVVLGSLMALAVTSATLALERRWSVAFLALATLVLDAAVYSSAVEDHTAAEGNVAANQAMFGKVHGTVYWDASVDDLGTVAIDQFSALNAPMPNADLTTSDLAIGDAAMVGANWTKGGYRCVGRSPYGSKLVEKIAGADNVPCQ